MKKKFNVYGVVTGTKFLGVFEANTKEEAIQMASPEASACLCHQCDSECQDAEIHDIIAEEDT
jgi:hypothetical protein